MVLRSLWGRLKIALTGRMRQRVTRSGVIFSLLISLVGAVAVLSANNVLFLLLSALLSVLFISGFLNRLSLSGLELDVVLPEHVAARRPIASALHLKNEKSWVPSFSIQILGARGSVYSSPIYFPALPGGSTMEETVAVVFQRRGVHNENSFHLRSRFPFGFAERTVQVTMRKEVLVYPCLDPQPGFDPILRQLEGELDAYARGAGHDFYRIRPYEHGESARHLDWKATAHTSQLQVREFAREQEALVEVYLDLDVPHAAGAWFETAVDCCAFLCWQVNRRGARLRFRTQGWDLEVPSQGSIYTILKYLALVEPRSYRNASGPGKHDSLQVVFSANAERMVEAGWNGDHVFGLHSFAAIRAADTAAGAAGPGARTRP